MHGKCFINISNNCHLLSADQFYFFEQRAVHGEISVSRGHAMKRNETGSFVEMWMDIDAVMWSEGSRKEKNKGCLLMHICGV